jgi:hypothetical protein
MIRYCLALSVLFSCFACEQHSSPTTTKVKADSVAVKTDTLTQEQVEAASTKSDDYNENTLPQSAHDLIPENYGLLNATYGDLNRDSINDLVMVLYRKGEEDSSGEVKRPLLLLVGQPDSTYKLVAKSEKAVYCKNCGGMMGDPFQRIAIKNGYFSVEHYGGSAWRWTRTITFKYNAEENKWYLHKDGSESFHAADPEKVTSKILTMKDFGKVAFEDFDVYKEN